MVPDSHISVNLSSSTLPLESQTTNIGSGGFHVHMECIESREKMMLREHHLLKDNNQFLTVDFVCCVQSQQTPELLFTTAEFVLYE